MFVFVSLFKLCRAYGTKSWLAYSPFRYLKYPVTATMAVLHQVQRKHLGIGDKLNAEFLVHTKVFICLYTCYLNLRKKNLIFCFHVRKND